MKSYIPPWDVSMNAPIRHKGPGFQSDKLHYNKRYEITSILIQSPICIILNAISYYKPLHHHINTRSRALIRSSRCFMNE